MYPPSSGTRVKVFAPRRTRAHPCAVAGRSVQDVAKDMLAIAHAGLKRRNRLSAGMVDETNYLGELEDIAETGVTAAEHLLDLYHGAWRGDVSEVFETCAY